MNKYKVTTKTSNPDYEMTYAAGVGVRRNPLYLYQDKIVEADAFNVGHSGSLTLYSNDELGLPIMAFPSGTWEFVELVKEENNG